MRGMVDRKSASTGARGGCAASVMRSERVAALCAGACGGKIAARTVGSKGISGECGVCARADYNLLLCSMVVQHVR